MRTDYIYKEEYCFFIFGEHFLLSYLTLDSAHVKR